MGSFEGSRPYRKTEGQFDGADVCGSVLKRTAVSPGLELDCSLWKKPAVPL